MEYGNFYDIAKYGNEAWRGFFSQKEIAENAYIYLQYFKDTVYEHIVDIMTRKKKTLEQVIKNS